MKNRRFMRSLYVYRDIKRGDIISHENIKSIRPGYGLHPKYLNDVLGKKTTKDMKVGDRLSFDIICNS